MAAKSPAREDTASVAPSEELRMIPLSQIVVGDRINPRGEVLDDEELAAMAQTMRERGCLQSIRVRRLRRAVPRDRGRASLPRRDQGGPR